MQEEGLARLFIRGSARINQMREEIEFVVASVVSLLSEDNYRRMPRQTDNGIYFVVIEVSGLKWAFTRWADGVHVRLTEMSTGRLLYARSPKGRPENTFTTMAAKDVRVTHLALDGMLSHLGNPLYGTTHWAAIYEAGREST